MPYPDEVGRRHLCGTGLAVHSGTRIQSPMGFVPKIRSRVVPTNQLEESRFDFCPYDGFSLSPRKVAQADGAGRCPGCGFVDFRNPRPCVGVIIEGADGVLLGQRGVDVATGAWDLPGGFIEGGESAEKAVEREILEETGLFPEHLRYLCSLPDVYGPTPEVPKRIATLNLIFMAELGPGDAQPASDVVNLQWFSVADLPTRMAFPHQREALELYHDVLKNSTISSAGPRAAHDHERRQRS